MALFSCLFHGWTEQAVLQQFPECKINVYTLRKALQNSFDWKVSDVALRKNKAETKRPKIMDHELKSTLDVMKTLFLTGKSGSKRETWLY